MTKDDGSSDSDRIVLGLITGAHGIRGEVVIRPFTAEPEAIADYGPLSDRAGARAFVIRSPRAVKAGVVVRIEGIADRNAAEALKGTELYVARSALPEPEADEWYHADLIGLAAVAPDGSAIGRVVAVQNFGAGDLIEIERPGRRETALVPFRDAFVPAVDIEAGRLVVDMDLDDRPAPGDGDVEKDVEGGGGADEP
ncbi:MAG: ribosome maturation factor RimM [Hyphomicrobiaceae bacterium]